MAKVWLVVCVLALAGCGFPRPADVSADAASSSTDSNTGNCFGTFAQVCLFALPTQPLMTADGSLTTLDTRTSPLCTVLTSGDDYCVVAATNIILAGGLRASGTRPLVLLSMDSITNMGEAAIDVGSGTRLMGVPEAGAAADPPACDSGSAPTVGGFGGGAGGSFLRVGGPGGQGNNGAAPPSQPGAAANPGTRLRGGCPGQDGDGASLDRGVQGHGGGAVLLIARNRIDIGGGVLAGGAGGTGGLGNRAGGGGGGAGGMIVLDAPTVTGSGPIIANGGAGGGGCASTSLSGSNGHDAVEMVEAATGGTTGPGGGNGGDGSSSASSGFGKSGLTGSNGGGGGGGGGQGVIIAPAGANLGSSVSPSAL